MEKRGHLADAKCRNLTAPWVRQKKEQGVELCEYFEDLDQAELQGQSGVYTLEEFKGIAKDKHFCPYFYARKLIPNANVVIYSYHYLLDPKVAEIISRELSKDAIVVFDEAHNIGYFINLDNVCTESLSIDITRPMLDASARTVRELSERIKE